MKTIILILLVCIPSLFAAKQPIYYKLGKHFYKKEKYNMSLWFLNHSKEKINREYRGEYYDILHEIYLNKEVESLKQRCDNLAYSNRCLLRAEKYKFYNQSEYLIKEDKLKDSCTNTVFSLISSHKKSRSLYKIISSSESSLSIFQRIAYKIEFVKNEEDLQLYLDELKTYLKSESYNSLNIGETTQVENIIKSQLGKIFLSEGYELVAQFEFRFRKYFGEKIRILSGEFQKEMTDSILMANYEYKEKNLNND